MLLLQSPFNNALSWMQDSGVIPKLVDQGYYELVGKNAQLQNKFREFKVEEWKPIMYQTMILAYFAFSVGLTLAIISFITEMMHGQKKQRGLQSTQAWRNELPRDGGIGGKELSR